MSFQVDLNNLKSSLSDLEELLDQANIGAIGGRSRGISPEHYIKYGLLMLKLQEKPLI